MKCLAIAPLVLSIFLVASSASAQEWTATSQLNRDRSPGSCQNDGTKVSFTVANGKLVFVYGRERNELAMAADGSVKQEIKGANGARGIVSGQVSTKALEFQNLNSGCRYTFVPG